ncbi:hypothetical protein GDO81_011681 [Engystomops pustulosus]|uniref:Uncharacterized protein n=1 Tax=Engystomops pustulosus TaxID=76066 RepID=A0AAV7BFZ8_ENGPU|nr:hypothetical protein GDO81_011681 [Engystomops pustulosus]
MESSVLLVAISIDMDQYLVCRVSHYRLLYPNNPKRISFGLHYWSPTCGSQFSLISKNVFKPKDILINQKCNTEGGEGLLYSRKSRQ